MSLKSRGVCSFSVTLETPDSRPRPGRRVVDDRLVLGLDRVGPAALLLLLLPQGSDLQPVAPARDRLLAPLGDRAFVAARQDADRELVVVAIFHPHHPP